MSFFDRNGDEYVEEIRKIEPTDPAHADVINALAQDIINNGAFLKKLSENILENLNGHLNDTENPHGVTPANIGAEAMYMQEVDLSDVAIYDVNTWYPIVGEQMTGASSHPFRSKGYHHIKCNVTLNSDTNPPWATHTSSGFSCNLDLLAIAGQWGGAVANTIVLDYSYIFCEENPLGFTQITTNNRPVIFCRGGGKYYVWNDYTDSQSAWIPYTTETGYGGMTVKPMTANPGIFNTKKATVIADLEGTATKAIQDSSGNTIADTYALKKDTTIYKRYNISSDKKLVTSLKNNIADIMSLTSGISPVTIVFGQDWVLVGVIDVHREVFSFVAFAEVSTGKMYSGYYYRDGMHGIYEYTGTLKDV